MQIHFKNYQKKDRLLDLTQPQIMGILNFTPDSFSDSGKFFSLDKALFQVEKMLNDGADIIDIGGESTRPNAELVTLEQELERVVPLVEAVRKRFDCLISVDSSKAEVFKQSAEAGADILNDIRALTEPNALDTAVELGLPICLMHMQGNPQNMQQNPCMMMYWKKWRIFSINAFLNVSRLGFQKNILSSILALVLVKV
ncbi:dihydropteroate synthase [Actinobacillus suis]|nr:dihydropteroate synthase [Actinobacillus suis]UTH25735.1 dihydropteroate synthase [Actinobacillus suis]